MVEEVSKPASALTKAKGPKATLKELLESEGFRMEVGKALADGNAESFVRAALTAATRNPELYKVTQDSLFTCLFDLAQMGLYPDNRRAHLIPFGDKCTLIIDYKGIAELARRHGDVAYIHCDVVHQGEHYICEYGTNGRLEHRPDPDREDLPITHAYSHVKFYIPETKQLVDEYTQMSVKQIEKVRNRSRAANKGPWVSDWEEMAKKTVFRRHSKTLALSPETRKALEYGEEEEYGEEKRFRRAIPAQVPKSVDFEEEEPDKGNQGDILPPSEGEKPKKSAKSSKIAEAAHKAAKATESVERSESPFESVQKETRESKKEPYKPTDTELFGTPSDAEMAEADTEAYFHNQLNRLIAESRIDKSLYFEWLRHMGIKHRALDKHPEAVVMTAIDLKPSDLEDAVEGWSVNFQIFNEWRTHRGQK